MREKLKREIAPLLSKNKKVVDPAANANKPENKPIGQSHAGQEPARDSGPTEPAAFMAQTSAAAGSGNGPLETANSPRASGTTNAALPNALSADRGPMRPDVMGIYAASSREGKRLNMLGFGDRHTNESGGGLGRENT